MVLDPPPFSEAEKGGGARLGSGKGVERGVAINVQGPCRVDLCSH